MLRLEHIAMRYGQGPEILRDINLTLHRGDFVLIMGPTGAGKTSLLRLLGLMYPPSAGQLWMSGRDVTGMSRRELGALRRRIGIVFQDFRLLDHLSTFDNVALPLRIQQGEEAEIRELVLEMLAWLGLSRQVEAKPPALSMGQRQLVAVARAVITSPDLLLCDEPTSNIDRTQARRVMRLLSRFAKAGSTVVVSTHASELAADLDRPVLHMSGGRLCGPAAAATAIAAAE